MQTEKTVTDDIYLEQRAHGEAGFPFRYYEEDVWQFAAHSINWHWHREIEVVFAARGEIFCSVGKDEFVLREGCGLFVNSGVLHRYAASGSVFMPNILFLPALLGDERGNVYQKFVAPVLREGDEYLILRPDGAQTSGALAALLCIFEAQKGGADELDTLQALLAFWKRLFECMPRAKGQSGRTIRDMQLRQMMAFIHENFDRKLTLQEIAASVYVSKNTALQIFKELIRMSPVAYLIQYRLARAAELLLSEEVSVTRVAEQTGFDSSGYFCRQFRKAYGCTPSEYRSANR